MGTAEAILRYLEDTYRPEAIIVYGSFADGTNGDQSDFDALIIAGDAQKHDTSVVAGTALDVFIYPPDTFLGEYDPGEFVQVSDGNLLLDRSGLAARLKQRVLEYLESRPARTADEIRQAIDWCDKMLARTARRDPEGCYRWHWLLTDSLEIYFDARQWRYRGPKKSLLLMKQRDAEGYALYSRALQDFTHAALADWVAFLRRSASGRRRPDRKEPS